jgi:LmbE family N-acetylglucosaminyl deacetylase
MQKLSFITIVFLFFVQLLFAQQPQKPNAVEIYHQIQKLNFLGSVLYIAAHPDDENTRLISYFSNEQKARTAYLSLTRGDGGQNLIGPELRELLGVIRTQELIEARKIDGGEQFFSTANDFGYSKNPDETLQIWDKEKVLSDVIYIIRKFQPDIIINRFDARTPGTTHGHHTSSAILSVEAFDKANDASICTNQLDLVSLWQPKRLFYNTSWWFYGSKENFEKADKSSLIPLQIGVYYPSLGKSNQEIAALSRSKHQSQGFGTTGTRGEELEYLEFIKGNPQKDKTNFFEGIDTSWNRIQGGKAIGELLSKVEKNFDFKNPASSIPDLVKAYSMIQNVEETHWKPIKSEEIKKIIAACSGLYVEATANEAEATPGSQLKITCEVINRSEIPMQLTAVNSFPTSNTDSPFQVIDLKNNISRNLTLELTFPENSNYTTPYWLINQQTLGMYQVSDQSKIGIPDSIRDTKVTFNILVQGVVIPFEKTVVYKKNDDVKGETYRPFDIVPIVSTSILNKVIIFSKEKTKTVGVTITAGKDKISGTAELKLPENWEITPKSIPFAFDKKGEDKTVFFQITAPKNADEATLKSIAIIDGKTYEKEQFNINYNHISRQQVLKSSEAKCIKLDLKTGDEKIAYIMGAGDEIPKSLTEMGYDVSMISPDAISPEKLKPFQVVITGIRAYNTLKTLAFKQSILFNFVKEGHTMIVQYNTTGDLVTTEIAPFPLKLSRDRVTDENAEVTFLEPNHSILNYPNKITKKDFEGWKQEQGLYYPNEWDKAFTPILASNDKGETPKKGALLAAKYGKGNYIYTSLSFFRELPEGVSGAFRLMANLISIP